MRSKLLKLVLPLLMLSSPAWAATYKISPADSKADFEIVHKIGFTTGWILIEGGKLELDEKTFQLKKLELTLDADSLTTHNEDKDVVAKSKEFFDVQAFPTMRVSSIAVQDTTLTAAVTIKNKTKDVSFDFKVWGIGTTEDGKKKVLMSLSATLKKEDFGLDYNVTDDDGNALLGDDLRILIRLIGIQ